MNKRYLLFFSSLLICFGVSAQRQNLYFFKKNGQQVKLRDSADYLRIVQEPEPGSALYVVNEHYLDGTTKSTGLSSKVNPPVYEGQYISYYRNGKKKMVANYDKGKLADTAYQYYPNGNLYTVIAYAIAPDGKTSSYIKCVKDSTGKDLVTDGSGQCGFYDSDFKRITESGSIRNGLYEGVWNGGAGNDGSTYKETYVAGTMVSGERTERDGSTYTYTKSYIQPQFKGGMDKFYTFLSKTLRYPAECQRKKIEGRVMLSFTVTKDGSLTNIKVLSTPDPLLAAEAVRVANASPLWEPGIQRGKAVNVLYNIPVVFSLH
jgi:TonB family protein